MIYGRIGRQNATWNENVSCCKEYMFFVFIDVVAVLAKQ